MAQFTPQTFAELRTYANERTPVGMTVTLDDDFDQFTVAVTNDSGAPAITRSMAITDPMNLGPYRKFIDDQIKAAKAARGG